MKFLCISFLVVFSFTAVANAELSALKEQQVKNLDEYKKSNPGWKELPNEEYLKFYSEWSSKNLEDDLELRSKLCSDDKAQCLSEKETEAMKAQMRVAVKVIELRNEYAKSNPSKVDQVKIGVEIERAANVSLCQMHAQNCDTLSKKDLALVEQLKRRDARIEGMEAEFAIHMPEWKEKKGDKSVMEFLLRRENELLSLNLKLNDHLCHEYPKDTEFCLEESQIRELQVDTTKVNCLHQRIHQLYNLAKEDVDDKEKIMVAGHVAQWESLEKKDCKYLLAQDRLGENLTPAPAPVVVAAPLKEEVYGDNDDEKNPRNFDSDSCQWVNDLPRKISYMPGCGSRGACIGYVVCNQLSGGGKFVRTSTCSPQFCGGSKQDAVSCTKQGGYYTRKAKDESKEFVSEKLKRIFSGAIKQ